MIFLHGIAENDPETAKRTAVIAARQAKEGGGPIVQRNAALVSAATVLTFGQWVERYYKVLVARRVVTAKDIRARLLKWSALIVDKAIKDITSEDVRVLVMRLDQEITKRDSWLETDEDERDDGAPGISWKTAANVWGDITTAFNEAHESKDPTLRVLKHNPCSGVRGPDRGTERAKPFLRPAHVAALLSCDRVPLARRVTYAVAIYTAMRQSEMRALMPTDIDFTAMQISVTKQVRKATAEARKRSKTGRARKVAIEPNLAPLLRWLVDHPMGKRGRMLSMPPAEDCAELLRRDLATAQCKGEWTVNDAQRAPIVFHSLRNTCGIHMAIRGDQPFAVQWRLGHTNAQMSERYIERAKEAAGANFGAPLDRLPTCLPRAEIIPAKVLATPERTPKNVAISATLATPTGIENSPEAPEIVNDSSRVGDTEDRTVPAVETPRTTSVPTVANDVESTLRGAVAAALAEGDDDLAALLLERLRARKLERVDVIDLASYRSKK